MNYALLLLSNLATLLQYFYFNEIRYSRERMYIVICQCCVKRLEKQLFFFLAVKGQSSRLSVSRSHEMLTGDLN